MNTITDTRTVMIGMRSFDWPCHLPVPHFGSMINIGGIVGMVQEIKYQLLSETHTNILIQCADHTPTDFVKSETDDSHEL